MKANHNVRIQYVSCITVFLLMTLIISGCGKSLSRSKAAEIISQSQGFPKSVYYRLPVARVSRDSFSILSLPWDDYLRAWTKLESMGIISLKRLWVRVGFLKIPVCETVEISLTDKGRTIFTHDKKHFWKMELCKKVFVEVTGISKRNDGTAIVEYTWKYDNISPVANAVLPISDLRGKNLTAVYKNEVVMRKYDDGWRIVD